jgi:glycosyltransferase involved in cell wall biosynthesis
MTTMPLVSVVIATYNMARYLPLAIRSALAQTYSPIEIHVVDDGSTDGTAEALAAFAGESRVIVHTQPNRGQASAKNRGIEASSGDLVAFLDADDLWVPHKLSRQVPVLLAEDRTGVVYSDLSHIDTAGHAIAANKMTPHSGRITDRLFIDNFITFGSVLVKRECFERHGTFDESLQMGIDWDLWLRISTGYEFIYIDEPLILYRIWDGQMSRNSQTRFECTMRTMRRFLERYPGLLAPSTVHEAWADTYTGQGWRLAAVGRKREAFDHFVGALSQQPTYLSAWKGLVKLAVRGFATGRADRAVDVR